MGVPIATLPLQASARAPLKEVLVVEAINELVTAILREASCGRGGRAADLPTVRLHFYRDCTLSVDIPIPGRTGIPVSTCTVPVAGGKGGRGTGRGPVTVQTGSGTHTGRTHSIRAHSDESHITISIRPTLRLDTAAPTGSTAALEALAWRFNPQTSHNSNSSAHAQGGYTQIVA